MTYQEEKKFLGEKEAPKEGVNKKHILSTAELKQITTTYPEAPQDYLDYLLEIGAGVIREIQFDVKPFLFDFSDLGLDDIYGIGENIKFFGDNLSGDFAGFDLDKKDGKVVEFLHDSGELSYTNKSFRQFIRKQMLIDENGNDMRALKG